MSEIREYNIEDIEANKKKIKTGEKRVLLSLDVSS